MDNKEIIEHFKTINNEEVLERFEKMYWDIHYDSDDEVLQARHLAFISRGKQFILAILDTATKYLKDT